MNSDMNLGGGGIFMNCAVKNDFDKIEWRWKDQGNIFSTENIFSHVHLYILYKIKNIENKVHNHKNIVFKNTWQSLEFL